MHALKLALNKSMRASDDGQGMNKLRPNHSGIQSNGHIVTKAEVDEIIKVNDKHDKISNEANDLVNDRNGSDKIQNYRL